MKKIGLIGGMSWESTLLYYKLLNEKVKETLGGAHSANCVIESVDFAEIAELQSKNDWPLLDRMMQERSKLLDLSGAEMILICANTMHLCVPAISQCTETPVIHIAEVTAEAINEQDLKKVALLGTKFTMEKDFFKDILKNNGIEVIVPEQIDRDLIHQIIYKELVNGIIKEDSKRMYIRTIKKLIDHGAEGVILGCTEIPLLVYPEDIEIPLFNTTKLHAEKAVEIALSKK